METNFKNNLAPAVIELNLMNDELKAENTRLKNKVAAYEDERKCLSETITCDANVIYNLNKENAELKCLALHAISEVVRLTAMVSRMFIKTKGIYGHWYNPLLLTEGAIQSAYDRARRLHNAYRKAKKALMEGK